jgi:hypothetical protein
MRISLGQQQNRMTLGARGRSVLLALPLAVLACDPGFRFSPVGWMPAPPRHWERQFEGFSVRTESLGGLTGEWWLSPRFQVFANEQRVTVRSAMLHTETGDYLGVIDERVMHLPPGGGAFLVSWQFDKQHRAPEVLGKHATIVLEFLVGSKSQTVHVIYQRARCC